MDQLIFVSLSHTHCWYEVGMLKVPAVVWGVRYSRCPSLWLLFDCCTPFPPPSFYSAVWRTRCPCPCFVFLSGLSCTTYICIWLPFLPYAYYMWLPWFVSFLFLGFSPPESLPGDDVLCRLLPRPLPSVCFLFFFPTVLVPHLFWCNFLYLVTTAGFVADQLIM